MGLSSSESNSENALYDQAVAIVARDQKCSTSYIQRRLSIGYNKAAKIVELWRNKVWFQQLIMLEKEKF